MASITTDIVEPNLSSGGSRSDWTRKYPPLLVPLLAIVMAVAMLPSSLNLPQSNPSQTLEYAPVPPTDEDVTPPVGNFSELGLGETSGPEGDGAPGGDAGGPGDLPPPPPPTGDPGIGKTPSTKRCVGNPPRQTEDPLSPPCVPDFNCAENGGATYQGVFDNEIKVLFYFDSGIVDTATSRGDESRPTNTYYDLAGPPEADEHVYVRLLRGWQRYFNDRFQTYCRSAHFYVYFGSRSDDGPEAKRADAADNFSKIKPFAVVSESLASNDAYLEAMSRRGVLNFGSFIGRKRDFFTSFPGLIWGYSPPLESQADHYADFVCKKLGGPTSFSGSYDGQARKFGLIHTTDPNQPQYVQLADLVRARVQDCGITISATGTFPVCCLAQDATSTEFYADQVMADFQSNDITTILWPGGVEGTFSDAAFSRQYFPEWVLLGDGQHDGFVSAEFQNQEVWDHAVVVTHQTKVVDREQEACFLAYKDANPSEPNRDVRGRACALYNNLRNLFIGIQVAGPYLGPTSIDQGFHAIPGKVSDDPTQPGCFYNPGDYTCVKDGVWMYWDSTGQAPNASETGCWRMPDGGKRYLFGTFDTADPAGQMSPQTAPCNGYGGNALYIGPGPGTI